MIDLIQETKDYMTALGYKKEDIAWIGCKNFTVPIKNFWDCPPQMYDAGYGTQHVAADLIIMFQDNTWLERKEYDGSEWWEHRQAPQEPMEYKYVTNFIDNGYNAEYGLAYINK